MFSIFLDAILKHFAFILSSTAPEELIVQCLMYAIKVREMMKSAKENPRLPARSELLFPVYSPYTSFSPATGRFFSFCKGWGGGEACAKPVTLPGWNWQTMTPPCASQEAGGPHHGGGGNPACKNIY